MTTQLTDFKHELLERLLDIAWRQWTTAGVSGRGAPWTGSVIDPEALLLFSCTIGRYDARLFDAIQEWLRVNGQFINVQRLKRIVKEERFSRISRNSIQRVRFQQLLLEIRLSLVLRKTRSKRPWDYE